MEPIKNRIDILDGFRAIAILLVLFYHFFSSWTLPYTNSPMYPYGDKYSYFKFGFTGVEFFFIISGFVIFFSLDYTSNFITFWKKRAIRLLPSVIIASIITFLFLRFFDSNNLFPTRHAWINFIPSITFLPPNLLNFIFQNKIQFNYINGSYWSLWPEIQFYFLVSSIYFLKKNKFIEIYILASVIIIIANFLLNNIKGANYFHLSLSETILNYHTHLTSRVLNIVVFIPFFSSGVLFYLLFKNKKLNIKTPLIVKCSLAFFILSAISYGNEIEIKIIYGLFFLLFFVFIYWPDTIKFFTNRYLLKIGVCSYFLYLIHEVIGVLLINKFSAYLKGLDFLFPLLLIIVLIAISYLYTVKIEKRVDKFLRNKLN